MKTNPGSSPLATSAAVPVDLLSSTEIVPAGTSGESKEPQSLKLDEDFSRTTGDDPACCAASAAGQASEPEVPAKAGVPKRYRRLKRHEVVRRGDFVADGHKGLEPWEGLSGFRADAFVKPIYRRNEASSAANNKNTKVSLLEE